MPGSPDAWTLDEYQRLALRTDDGNTVTDDQMTICCGLGVAGEAGEVADLIKKWAFHGKPLDQDKLVKEMGDVLWYLSVLAARRGISLEDVARANIAKLRARYPKGFSHAAANARADETPVPGGRLASCACYVKQLDPEAQMTLRWGAHAETCPTYRPSGDPVDAANDEATRRELQGAVRAQVRRGGQ